MTFDFHAEAQREYEEAGVWYEEQRFRLGLEYQGTVPVDQELVCFQFMYEILKNIGLFAVLPAIVLALVLGKTFSKLRSVPLFLGCWTAVVVLLAMLVAVSSVAFPLRVRHTTSPVSCTFNLRQIDGAKEQWSLENKKSAGTTVDTAEMAQYLRGGVIPGCPSDGRIMVNVVGSNATCSLGEAAWSHPYIPTVGSLMENLILLGILWVLGLVPFFSLGWLWKPRGAPA